MRPRGAVLRRVRALGALAMTALILLPVLTLWGAELRGAEGELREARRELAEIENACRDFGAVRERYSMYTLAGYDTSLPGEGPVLDLLERQVFPRCAMRRFQMSGGVLRLTVGDVTLGGLSALVGALEGETMVEGVTVDSAGGGEAELTVTLRDAGGTDTWE